MGWWVNIFLESCVQPKSESRKGQLKQKTETTERDPRVKVKLLKVIGHENTVLSELHKTVYATGLKLHFKLPRLNYIFHYALQHCSLQ